MTGLLARLRLRRAATRPHVTLVSTEAELRGALNEGRVFVAVPP